MTGAHVEIARVRRHAEGLFLQVVIIQNHLYLPKPLCFGTDANTGILRTSNTSAGVRNDGLRYSATNATAALTKTCKNYADEHYQAGLIQGRIGRTGGTAMATLAMRFSSRASEVRSCSRLET